MLKNKVKTESRWRKRHVTYFKRAAKTDNTTTKLAKGGNRVIEKYLKIQMKTKKERNGKIDQMI